MSLASPSASARPFVTSGIALAKPPVPVLVPTPAPLRLSQHSSVNVDAPNPGAAPKVTYWLLPLNCSAVPANDACPCPLGANAASSRKREISQRTALQCSRTRDG